MRTGPPSSEGTDAARGVSGDGECFSSGGVAVCLIPDERAQCYGGAAGAGRDRPIQRPTYKNMVFVTTITTTTTTTTTTKDDCSQTAKPSISFGLTLQSLVHLHNY